MLAVRLMRSDRWLHDRLLREASPPRSYAWATNSADADISIFLTPVVYDAAAPERLHALRLRDLGRLFVFSQSDIPLPWAPGLYTSLSAKEAGPGFVGGCYAIPGYFAEPGGVGDLLDDLATNPDLLWTFLGSVSTHEPVRRQILALKDERGMACDSRSWNVLRWGGAGDVAAYRREAVAAYVDSVGRAKFVVAPRGVGPSSLRLFEAMRARRVPVVVSDDWLPPAFVDWESCMIRIPERDIERLPMILRERESEAVGLGARARDVWEKHFSPKTMVHYIAETCLRLYEHNPRGRRRAQIALSGLLHRQTVRRGRVVIQNVHGRAIRAAPTAQHLSHLALRSHERGDSED